MLDSLSQSIAIAFPCHNEGNIIAKVIDDFRREIPEAEIWVIDNASTDNTFSAAQEKGVRVIKELKKGKGHAVARMFAEINTDLLVMCDGDDSYDPGAVKKLIHETVLHNIDMMIGKRVRQESTQANEKAYRFGHVVGNKMFNKTTSLLFGETSPDILSGYRVFQKRFYKTIPIKSKGFEIETEMTIHAYHIGAQVSSREIHYRNRGAGTVSKLNTYRDGIRILFTIIKMVSDYKPLAFFGAFSLLAFLLGLALFCIPLQEYLTFHQVRKIPTLIVSMTCISTSIILFLLGYLKRDYANFSRDTKKMALLSYDR